MRIARQDLLYAAGSSQLRAGKIGGCEAAVHAMKQIFSSPSVDAVLLVDASNAFNELNRQVTLRNVEAICPVLAPILINTYRQDTFLFAGGHTIFSSEGTTQGDPLAMAMYAIGTLPLIDKLQGIVQQCWYADDSAGGGTSGGGTRCRFWDLGMVIFLMELSLGLLLRRMQWTLSERCLMGPIFTLLLKIIVIWVVL